MASRTCKARNDKGQPCGARPMRDNDYCVFHDPEHAEVVQEARRAGGQRRKREAAVATAFDFQGLTSIEEIRRLVEVAAFDALGLSADNADGMRRPEQDEACRKVAANAICREGLIYDNRDSNARDWTSRTVSPATALSTKPVTSLKRVGCGQYRLPSGSGSVIWQGG